ncbi:MAG: adenylyl-sulfate kinase [Cyclobacteriaceae bacterium]
MNQLHIIPHDHEIKLPSRIERLGNKPLLIWLTGLSGSGKSTIANALEKRLFADNFQTYVLDGDNIRSGLNKDLGFDDSGRIENIRRIGEVARLFVDAGTVVITAFISPFEREREMVREIVGADNYFQIFVDCPLEECEKRDVKGLYKKARKGEIKNFTGIDSPFEKPVHPDLIVNTVSSSLDDCIDQIFDQVIKRIKQ